MIVHLEKSRLNKFSPDLIVTQKSVHPIPSLKHPLRPPLFYYHVTVKKLCNYKFNTVLTVWNYVTSLAGCAYLLPIALIRSSRLLRLQEANRAFACP